MKKTRKILAVAIGVMMLVSLMSLTVSADTVFGYNAVLGSAASVSGGAVNVASASSAANSQVKFYLNSDQSAVEGDIYIEYTLSVANTSVWQSGASNQLQFVSDAGGALDLRWRYDYRDTANPANYFIACSTNDANLTNYSADQTEDSHLERLYKTLDLGLTRLNVLVKYNSATGMMSLYLNGSPAYENISAYSGRTANAISYVTIGSNVNNSQTTPYKIEKFRWGYETIGSLTEETATVPIYETDFSEGALNTGHIDIGTSTAFDSSNQYIKAEPTTANQKIVDIYGAREGTTETTIYEFDISQDGLTSGGQNQIQIRPYSTAGAFADTQWYGGSNPFYRVYASGTYQKSVAKNASKIHVKFRFVPTAGTMGVWVDGVEVLPEEGSNNYLRWASDYTNISYIRIIPNCALTSVTVDNIKIYKEQPANLPAIWEGISFDDFETAAQTTATDNGRLDILDASAVSYNYKDGCLWLYTGYNSSIVKSFTYDLKQNGSTMTDESVVEFTMKNSNSSSGLFRVWLSSKIYVAWNPAVRIELDYWDPGRSDVSYSIDDYNASSELKVTASFNPKTHRVKVWFNGIQVMDHVFTDPDYIDGSYPDAMDFYTLNGNWRIGEIRYYKPVTGVKMKKDGSDIKIMAESATPGTLYLAKYTGANGDELTDVGVTEAATIQPAKVYKMDASSWSGGKAFFWDADLNPLTDAVNIN